MSHLVLDNRGELGRTPDDQNGHVEDELQRLQDVEKVAGDTAECSLAEISVTGHWELFRVHAEVQAPEDLSAAKGEEEEKGVDQHTGAKAQLLEGIRRGREAEDIGRDQVEDNLPAGNPHHAVRRQLFLLRHAPVFRRRGANGNGVVLVVAALLRVLASRKGLALNCSGRLRLVWAHDLAPPPSQALERYRPRRIGDWSCVVGLVLALNRCVVLVHLEGVLVDRLWSSASPLRQLTVEQLGVHNTLLLYDSVTQPGVDTVGAHEVRVWDQI